MIEVLTVKNRSLNDVEVEAKLERLSIEDLNDIIDLQDFIIDGIEDKQIFAKTTKEEFEIYFRKNAYFLGIKLNESNKLIAVGVYISKADEKSNYGYDLDYTIEDILKTGQIETTVVHPDFRGNKLQEIICKKLIEVSKERDNKYLTATVSPYNPYSLNTFLKLGFVNKKEKMKYGGVLRAILELKL
ncbi:MAG: GNAT family N-acetyltransferase [Sarcina sp.]